MKTEEIIFTFGAEVEIPICKVEVIETRAIDASRIYDSVEYHNPKNWYKVYDVIATNKIGEKAITKFHDLYITESERKEKALEYAQTLVSKIKETF